MNKTVLIKIQFSIDLTSQNKVLYSPNEDSWKNGKKQVEQACKSVSHEIKYDIDTVQIKIQFSIDLTSQNIVLYSPNEENEKHEKMHERAFPMR